MGCDGGSEEDLEEGGDLDDQGCAKGCDGGLKEDLEEGCDDSDHGGGGGGCDCCDWGDLPFNYISACISNPVV